MRNGGGKVPECLVRGGITFAAALMRAGLLLRKNGKSFKRQEKAEKSWQVFGSALRESQIQECAESHTMGMTQNSD